MQGKNEKIPRITMDQFVTTPSSSDVDLLIEKFSIEVGNSIVEANSETRKLTITSPIKPETSGSNSIDQQITDLENLIKKLQDEITVMCKNADKEVKEYIPVISEETSEVRRDLSNGTIILDNECDNIEETKNIRDAMKGKDYEGCFEPGHYNHIYPLMIRDIIPLDVGNKNLEHSETDGLNKNTDEKIPEKISFIRQEIKDIWDDLPEYTPEEDLEDKIDELQAEISEKMETMMDNNIFEPSDKFEDA